MAITDATEKTDQTQTVAHQVEEATTSIEPTAIPPKEWHYFYDCWLHGIMCTALGNEANPEIPNLDAYKFMSCSAPDYKVDMELACDYVIHYNLHIKVAAGKNQVELFYQAFCEWYLKLKEANHQTIIYAWKGMGHNKEAATTHQKPHRYTNIVTTTEEICQQFFCTTGGAYYSYSSTSGNGGRFRNDHANNRMVAQFH